MKSARTFFRNMANFLQPTQMASPSNAEKAKEFGVEKFIIKPLCDEKIGEVFGDLIKKKYFCGFKKNMNENQIDIEKIVNHWIESSEDDYRTMVALYKSKTYNWALFMGHISIEKLLKAYYVKKHQTHAPFT